MYDGYGGMAGGAFNGYEIVGDLYYHGCAKAKLPTDKAAAAQWYEYAAIAHLPSSQFKLGKMLYEGDGIHRDESRGLTWMTSAALEKSLDAQKYLHALGIEVRPIEGPTSFERAKAEIVGAYRERERAGRNKLFGDLVRVVLTAGAVYYAGKELGGTTFPNSSAPAPVSGSVSAIQRYRPVSCYVNLRSYVTGTADLGYVTTYANVHCF